MKKTITWILLFSLLLAVPALGENSSMTHTQEEVLALYAQKYGSIYTWNSDILDQFASDLRQSKYVPGQKEGLAAISLFTYFVQFKGEREQEIIAAAREKALAMNFPVQDSSAVCITFRWCIPMGYAFRVLFSTINGCVYVDIDSKFAVGDAAICSEETWYAPFVAKEYFDIKAAFPLIWGNEVVCSDFWCQLEQLLSDSCWEAVLANFYQQYGMFIPAWPLEGKALESLIRENTHYLSCQLVYVSQLLPCKEYISVDKAISIAEEAFQAAGLQQRIAGITPEISLYSLSNPLYGITPAYEIAYITLDDNHQPIDYMGSVLVDAMNGDVYRFDGIGGFVG